jgi:short subunit dehydrogenase-like uncharacterized protein
MPLAHTVAVYGAYGHTGRFVVSELLRRGWTPILAGRDRYKLEAFAETHAGVPGGGAPQPLQVRPASTEDPAALDRALDGAEAVINCAGPFARTAGPLIDAALRARLPYLDVAAEVEAVRDSFDYDARARAAGVTVVPAVAFYGGLGNLLATAAMGDWTTADGIDLAYALSSWKPTLGTRASTQVSRQRRDGHRIAFVGGRLEKRTDKPPVLQWRFPEPIGAQTVVGEFTTADSVTIPRHVDVREIRTVMTLAPLADLGDPDLSPPPATDASGRSDQTFLVEVRVSKGTEERRAVARGRDIYAITAPLVVEAARRLLDGVDGRGAAGVFAVGQIFRAADFLGSLAPEPLSVELPATVAASAT